MTALRCRRYVVEEHLLVPMPTMTRTYKRTMFLPWCHGQLRLAFISHRTPSRGEALQVTLSGTIQVRREL